MKREKMWKTPFSRVNLLEYGNVSVSKADNFEPEVALGFDGHFVEDEGFFERLSYGSSFIEGDLGFIG